MNLTEACYGVAVDPDGVGMMLMGHTFVDDGDTIRLEVLAEDPILVILSAN